MNRLLIRFGVGILAFVVGVTSWAVVSKWQRARTANEPLRITVSSIQRANSKVDFDHYMVRLENVSTKTIRGFSLGSTCLCRSWDGEGKPLPHGITFTNPSPERQVLQPGGVLEMPFSIDLGADPTVWVDLVHFENEESNWGPNRSRTEGYVRTY